MLRLAVIALAALAWTTAAATADAKLPLVRVHTGEPIADRGPKVDGRMVAGRYRGPIGIETRGSFSRTFPKKPYELETRTRRGGNRNVRLLGLPRENDWLLQAAYTDRSLMRDALVYATSRWMGRYAARSRFVRLRLNGEPMGVYVLTEKLKRDDRRVEADLLLEVGDEREEGGWVLPRSLQFAEPSDPDAGDLDRDERRFARERMAAAETALYDGGDWRALIDEDAAIDHVLLQELFKNEDAFHRSLYVALHEDRPLELGPVWDFDISIGNAGTGISATLEGFVTPHRPWGERLAADPVFVARTAERWRELRARGLMDHLLTTIDGYAAELAVAQRRNFERWPILGLSLFPWGLPRATWEGEVQHLRDWLWLRAAWIDANVDRLASG